MATARKLAVLVWHMLTKEQDYTWTRPALVQYKLRSLQLMAGYASRRGGNKPGPARDYSLKAVRDKELARMSEAEQQYRRFVSGWKDHPVVSEKPASRKGDS